MCKKILAVLLVIAAAACVFTACGNTYKQKAVEGAKASDPVVENGGFLVEKGEYTYFINGVAGSTVDNTFGTPVQGAIVVIKTADIGKAEPKIVVPKAIVAGDKTSGFYIFGDWIYYTTPTTDRNKNGEIQNTRLDFCRTKLDGTVTEKAFDIGSNSAVYRFGEVDGKTFAVYYDSSESILYSYDFTKKKMNKLAENVADYAFSTNADYAYAYYAQKVDLGNELKANYMKAYKISFAGGDAELVLSGEPKADGSEAVYSSGLTFDLLSHQDGMLVYSASYADTSTVRGCYVLKDKDAGTDAVKNVEEKSIKMCATDKNFTSGALLLNKSGDLLGFVYADTTYGLVRSPIEGEKTRMCTSTACTLVMVKDGYVYFKADKDFVRIPVDAENYDVKDAEKISSTLYSASWYKPKFVGNYLFYCNTENSRTYIYYADMTAEEKEGKFIGVYTEADKKAVEKELEEKAKEEENK